MFQYDVTVGITRSEVILHIIFQPNFNLPIVIQKKSTKFQLPVGFHSNFHIFHQPKSSPRGQAAGNPGLGEERRPLPRLHLEAAAGHAVGHGSRQGQPKATVGCFGSLGPPWFLGFVFWYQRVITIIQNRCSQFFLTCYEFLWSTIMQIMHESIWEESLQTGNGAYWKNHQLRKTVKSPHRSCRWNRSQRSLSYLSMNSFQDFATAKTGGFPHRAVAEMIFPNLPKNSQVVG